MDSMPSRIYTSGREMATTIFPSSDGESHLLALKEIGMATPALLKRDGGWPALAAVGELGLANPESDG